MAYFYFDFSNPEKQNATNFLSSLISQLCRQIVNIPEKLKELYKSCNAGKHTAAIQDLNAVLAHFAIIEDIDDVFIVTDALDECPNNGEEELRGELLKLIIEIKAWSKSKIHFLITSRPESDIQTALTPLLATEAIHIQGSYVDSDIKLYISSQLSTDPKLMKWPSEVKEQIEKTLTAGADGM